MDDFSVVVFFKDTGEKTTILVSKTMGMSDIERDRAVKTAPSVVFTVYDNDSIEYGSGNGGDDTFFYAAMRFLYDSGYVNRFPDDISRIVGRIIHDLKMDEKI